MSFSKKAAEIFHTLQTDYGDFNIPAQKKVTQDRKNPKTCKHNCSALEVKITPVNAKSPKHKPTRDQLYLQNPVIIEKKNQPRSVSTHRNLTERKYNSNLKKVEPFVPIGLPRREPRPIKV